MGWTGASGSDPQHGCTCAISVWMDLMTALAGRDGVAQRHRKVQDGEGPVRPDWMW